MYKLLLTYEDGSTYTRYVFAVTEDRAIIDAYKEGAGIVDIVASPATIQIADAYKVVERQRFKEVRGY